jgi:uncharacterized surface protein with fasciclin (FAS1) repeats
MKTNHYGLFLLVAGLVISSCSTQTSTGNQSAPLEEVSADGGQSTVDDFESQKNVVHIAVSSADHSTLVEAVKAAELVDALSNAGPFTVFAPVNKAFDKLPAGTVEGLLKPDQKSNLQDILEYHVALGVYKTENLRDGQVLGMVNGDNVTFAVSDGKVTINGANIIASLPASNGVVHVIDAVLLPK